MNAQSIFRKEQHTNHINLRLNKIETVKKLSILSITEEKLEIISYEYLINRKIKIKFAVAIEYKS